MFQFWGCFDIQAPFKTICSGDEQEIHLIASFGAMHDSHVRWHGPIEADEQAVGAYPFKYVPDLQEVHDKASA